MLLDTVYVHNKNLSGLMTLKVGESTSGIFVRAIEGLGPVKATLVSSNFANMDGAHFHSSRAEPRNIIFRLGLDPNHTSESVYDLREKIYKVFMPKKSVVMSFFLRDLFDPGEGFTRVIDGIVESCEPNLFTKDPTIDVSIMCYDPYFRDVDTVEFYGQSVLVDDSSRLILNYEGNVPVPLKFNMTVNRYADYFKIFNRSDDGVDRVMHFTSSLTTGDQFELSSEYGSKYAFRIRGSTKTYIMYGMTADSEWPMLYPGDNDIRVEIPRWYDMSQDQWIENSVAYKITYMPKYGGL